APPPGVKAPEGHTFLRVFTGPGTAFPEPRAKLPGGFGGGEMHPAGVKDGPADTLLAVEAAGSGPWTQPEERALPPKGPLPKLGVEKDRFAAVFFDMHARLLRTTLPERTLRLLIMPDDGEAIPPLD